MAALQERRRNGFVTAEVHDQTLLPTVASTHDWQGIYSLPVRIAAQHHRKQRISAALAWITTGALGIAVVLGALVAPGV